MADIYAIQQVGVADGTAIPAARADGREVGAPILATLASKPVGTALAANDRLYLGKKPAGCKLARASVVTGTSMGSATFDIGTAAAADKYVDGKGVTATDVPTAIGPKAAVVDDTPSDAEEDLWATVNTATIGAAVELTVILEFVGIS